MPQACPETPEESGAVRKESDMSMTVLGLPIDHLLTETSTTTDVSGLLL